MIGEHEAYCQPCVSPVWDTALTCHALLEVGGEAAMAKAKQGLDWLKPLQVLDLKGDWAAKAPDARPGGWAFQYNNAHYPDLDDTAVVVMAMDRAQRQAGTRRISTRAIARGREWIEGMQSRDGGWAAFDADNLEYYLNNIPFSDHGALLDPPTEDVTARCISMLAQLGETAGSSTSIADGIDYLRRTQLADGIVVWPLGPELHLWHLVGALCAKCRRGGPSGPDGPQGRPTGCSHPESRTAAGARMPSATDSITRAMSPRPRTASQTAWALLGLMAAGEVEHPEVARGSRVSKRHTDRKRPVG